MSAGWVVVPKLSVAVVVDREQEKAQDDNQITVRTDAIHGKKKAAWGIVDVRHVRGGWALTEAHKEVRNIYHVCGVPSGIMIHFVLFPRLVLDDIQENIDRRFAVPGCRTVPGTDERQEWGEKGGTGRRRGRNRRAGSGCGTWDVSVSEWVR